MWQSLLLKLGMFAATMGVVFWIGWTLPTSFDRARDLATESLEGPKAGPLSPSGPNPIPLDQGLGWSHSWSQSRRPDPSGAVPTHPAEGPLPAERVISASPVYA